MGLVGSMPSGALCPSKSGLMNKHIVKHTRPTRVNAFLGALYPSKSGLMNKHIHIVKHIVTKTNKHIVKHIVKLYFIFGALCPSKSGLMNNMYIS